jgi:hypothetical protein
MLFEFKLYDSGINSGWRATATPHMPELGPGAAPTG